MRRIAILSLFLSGLALNGTALAQSMPPFNLPQIITNEDVADLSVDFDDAFNTIDNPYLSDTMKLNYQISLLEKLVARQAQIEKISDSYDAMGLPYTPPSVPRGICEQLPVNAPCLQAHPDLFSDVVSARKAYYKSLEEKAKAAEPDRKVGESDAEVIARKKREAEAKAIKEAAAERKVRYSWTDVTCVLGQCHGILIKSKNPDARYTVHEGSRLPDGTLVQNISPHDVRVSIDGESIKVRPAPGEGAKEDSADNGANPIEAALAKAGVEPNDHVSSSKSAASAVIANAGGAPAPAPVNVVSPTAPMPPQSGNAAQSASEPPLGPSGLF